MNKQQKKMLLCTNCGVYGHYVKSCIAPITSYGCILLKLPDGFDQASELLKNEKYVSGYETILKQTKFLMIQRRDSLGFIEIMRGKYRINDIKYIKYHIATMTKTEHEKIISQELRRELDLMEQDEEAKGGIQKAKEKIEFLDEKENVEKKYQFDKYTYLTQITHDFLDDNTYFIKAVQRQYDILFGKKILTNRLHTWVPLIFNNGDTHLLNPNNNYELYRVTDGDFRYPNSNRFNGMLEEGLKSWDERKLFRENLTNKTLELIKHKLDKN
jgi:hypothetical protein